MIRATVRQGALHRFLHVSRAGSRDASTASLSDERMIESMRCRLAEARVSWGKGETDAALRAARAVTTRLRAMVGPSAGGGGIEGAGASGGHEEQLLLSEVMYLAFISPTPALKHHRLSSLLSRLWFVRSRQADLTPRRGCIVIPFQNPLLAGPSLFLPVDQASSVRRLDSGERHPSCS